ncbi:hypothetical protein GF345_05495 [Candidatus Woesearchaeota archaeon]|nr:hypothetical protein [Candidatus Woesearchaeota archaeon]
MTIDNKVIPIERKVKNIENGIWTIGSNFYGVTSVRRAGPDESGNIVSIRETGARGGYGQDFDIIIPIHYDLGLDDSEPDGVPRLFMLNKFDHGTSYHYNLEAFKPRTPTAMDFFKEDIRQNVIAQAMWWDNKYCNADYELKHAYGFVDFNINQKMAMIQRGNFPISGDEYRPMGVEDIASTGKNHVNGIVLQKLVDGKDKGSPVMVVVSSPNFKFSFDHGANGTSLGIAGQDGKPYNGSFKNISLDMPPELEGKDTDMFNALKAYTLRIDTIKTGRRHRIQDAFYN